jgi:hypothetical protein
MLPFDSIELISAVNKVRPVQTPVSDRHFGRTRQSGSNTVQIDTIQGPEGLMVAVSWDAESRKAKGRTVSTETLPLPRFSEHDFVTGLEQIQFRAPGVVSGGEAFTQLVAGKLASMRARIDRSREFMAMGALQGSVVDGAGNVVATYGVPSAVSVDFSTADVVSTFRTAKTAISRALGYAPSGIYAYCGPTALSRVLGNAALRSLIQAQMGVDLVTTGTIQTVTGVTFEEVPWQYVDNAGATQSFLGDASIVLAPTDADFETVYGPCLGKGGAVVMSPYLAEQTELDDPPATKLRVESNVLPVVNRPEAIYRITTTG